MLPKFYSVVDGKKFYAYEDGALYKNADTGENVEVPEDAEDDLQEVEKATVNKMTDLLGKATKKALDNADTVLAESTKKATDALNEMFESVTKNAQNARTKVASFSKENLSFDVDAVKENLKAKYERKVPSVIVEFKSVQELDYLAKATSESGSLTGDVIDPDRQPGLEREPVRRVFIEQIANVQPTTSNKVEYVEVTGESGAPAMTAELAAMTEKDYTFQVFEAAVKKIGVINKHSKEILNDAPLLVAKVKEMLREDIAIVLDNQLLNGDGTGQNLLGIFNTAEAYTATEVDTKRVADATLFDVIRVMMTYMQTVSNSAFMATHILLNPVDADELDLTKNANGDYILPPFYSSDGARVKGALVVTNTGVPAGEVLLGDFTKLHIHPRTGYEMAITDSDGTDFQKEIITVRLSRRIAAYVRNNDSAAFQVATIADIKAALVEDE